MSTELAKSLKLFYCYAREDKALRDELDRHLSGLKREYQITSWSDGEIIPGAEWQKEIDSQLNTANIILLLISAHFIASDYCYGIEMKWAIERHEAGTARVIPIILRRVYWENAPFSKLQVLPTDAKPVTQWLDRDEAFWNTTMGIRNAIKELIILLKTKEALLEEGNALRNLKRYDEALKAFEEIIRLDPSNATAWCLKGAVLGDLKRYNDAITASEQAIRLDPSSSEAWRIKGTALNYLKHYAEALAAHKQALDLDPNSTLAWNNKDCTLRGLKRHDEALKAFDQAIRLDPSSTLIWSNKGSTLCDLNRYHEALEAYEQAIRLDLNYALAWYNKGITLEKLRRSKEAQHCYEKARQLGYKA